MSHDRYHDLLKQGFMKPRRVREPKKKGPSVACAGCQDWHPEGKHTKPRHLRAKTRTCSGTVRNGPDKRFTRCSFCQATHYEKNEGDTCRRALPAMSPTRKDPGRSLHEVEAKLRQAHYVASAELNQAVLALRQAEKTRRVPDKDPLRRALSRAYAKEKRAHNALPFPRWRR